METIPAESAGGLLMCVGKTFNNAGIPEKRRDIPGHLCYNTDKYMNDPETIFQEVLP